MRKHWRLIPIALASSLCGALVGVALMYAGGEPFSLEDTFGVGVFVFVPALACCALFYAPGLLWLRRRRGGCRPPYIFPLVSALVLNVPAFAVILGGLLMNNFSGASEAALFLPAYVVAGLLFGLGFIAIGSRQ
ncbi:MAG TPA: hypothetical protein VGV38_18095 [Pyrinomonadaceae bacterium]|nr:hypothetical protein [Pyrinomonadaceae bacterium]